MKSVRISFIITLFFLQACSSNHVSNINVSEQLIKYFETNDIIIQKRNKVVSIDIKNSRFVQRQGSQWSDLEAFASIGALIFSDGEKPELTDSVIITVHEKMYNDKFAYKNQNLRDIRRYVDTSKKFCRLVAENNYPVAKLMMGNDILNKLSPSEIDNFFKKTFLNQRVKSADLIAFRVKNNIVNLYINVYYADQNAQTYILSFRLNGDSKIAGIHLP